MAVLKYRGSGGTIQTLLDVTGTLARIGALETKTNNLQTTVNTLNASSGWKRLSNNCWYKKVGLWCTVQCDYISLSASTWKALGTLPADGLPPNPHRPRGRRFERNRRCVPSRAERHRHDKNRFKRRCRDVRDRGEQLLGRVHSLPLRLTHRAPPQLPSPSRETTERNRRWP